MEEQKPSLGPQHPNLPACRFWRQETGPSPPSRQPRPGPAPPRAAAGRPHPVPSSIPVSQKPRPPDDAPDAPWPPPYPTRPQHGIAPGQLTETSPGPCCAGCGLSCCPPPPARTWSHPCATRRSSGRWTAMGTAWWTLESCSRGFRAWASRWARTPRRWVAVGCWGGRRRSPGTARSWKGGGLRPGNKEEVLCLPAPLEEFQRVGSGKRRVYFQIN